MQVVISLSQPEANEASGPAWSDPPHAARATAAKATATPLLTRSTLREDNLRAIWASGRQRAGSRVPTARRTARARARAATTPRAAGTPAAAATPPPIKGPRKKPNATELALKPNTVLCASDGVSSPIMLAVAGVTTPVSIPFRATAPTTSATHGAEGIDPPGRAHEQPRQRGRAAVAEPSRDDRVEDCRGAGRNARQP